jgi:hypothetical protein
MENETMSLDDFRHLRVSEEGNGQFASRDSAIAFADAVTRASGIPHHEYFTTCYRVVDGVPVPLTCWTVIIPDSYYDEMEAKIKARFEKV